VATEHIASQGKIVKMTEARQAAGLASALDVAQAKIVYYSTQASLPGLESSIHTTINSLATLLGVYPDEIYKKLEIAKPLPEYQRIVPVGVPADLLRRRPDVVQAEYEVAGYAAAVGIAKKDFLPTLAINGTIGTTAHKGDELFKNQSLTYSIAPTLTWTLFDGLARRANLISAREQYQIGVENYNLTVMTAVQEVDNAYSSYLSSLKSIDVLNQLVDQSRKALALSVDLYKSDLKPFSDVVSAQMSLLENQNSLVTSQGQALTSLIALYEALGGGWNANQIN
jgi:NodT family efflux transporter outer membrane factor (OMF) lipoprotein